MTWVLVRMNLGIITVLPPIATLAVCRASNQGAKQMSDIGCDIATVIAFGYALLFSMHFPSASPVGLVAAIVIALLAYKLVRALKAAFDKISARSFLQD
jgi:hypothetical protein